MTLPVVLKLGGAALQDHAALTALCAELKQLERPAVLVHGGGSVTDEMLTAAGWEPQKKGGQRVTPAAQIPVVCGALAGVANTELVAAAQQAGLQPVGLSLVEGPLVALMPHTELGAVGMPDFTAGRQPGRDLLDLLLAANRLPVISSIGLGPVGELLNVNADYAAAAIAQQLEAELVLLSDVPALLNEASEPVLDLPLNTVPEVLSTTWVSGGMQVKLQAASELVALTGLTVTLAGWQDTPMLSQVLRRSSTAVATRIHP